MACLIELAKKGRRHELHLVDAEPGHCKVTHLHKTFTTPVEGYTVPFAQLAEKFGFRFHHQRVSFAADELPRLENARALPLPQGTLDFDQLVISTGASAIPLRNGEKQGFGLGDLRRGRGVEVFNRLLERSEEEPAQITLVGGGATGIQILFELKEQLRRKRIPHNLRLVDLNERLVPDQPEGFHRYIGKKLQREEIEYYPETRYLDHAEQAIRVEDLRAGRILSMNSHLTLLFPGVTPSPFALESNAYGQVLSGQTVLPSIFSAGDCAYFHSRGLNLLTAQAAVRKGRLVARNILNLAEGKNPYKYRYQEKGYLISLGSVDAIGWLGLRCNLVKGFAASFIKDAMETQYDLFLDGVDTYLGFP
ncbi:NAD(P)/FAD-dependent oxidoreductase [Desulfuromonas versatilis]|nr:FAD-dependent oxidoreductase [Desulfuromonas versatilis]